MKFKSKAFISVVISVFVSFIAWLWFWRVPWSGFFEYTTKTTFERENKDPQSKVTKVTEEIQGGKTFWDVLQLAGIPFVLAGVGYVLNEREQEREEKRKEAEQKRVAENLREEVLQAYFGRIAEFLSQNNPSEPIANNTLVILRARTLTVLSRLDRDGQRKAAIIRFLYEAKLIKGGGPINGEGPIIDLSDADLRGANLSGQFLINANFSWANLSEANLQGANLGAADLTTTKLIDADLREADFANTNFNGARLEGANFRDATNLSQLQLDQARLCNTTLPDGTVSNRDCGRQLRVAATFVKPLPVSR